VFPVRYDLKYEYYVLLKKLILSRIKQTLWNIRLKYNNKFYFLYLHTSWLYSLIVASIPFITDEILFFHFASIDSISATVNHSLHLPFMSIWAAYRVH
jgi:hypothetical protein